MKKFSKIDVTEQQLEDVVRRYTEQVEKGLVFLDHQKSTIGGRLDVLLVDDGKALVLAELKIIQDDGMMMQGLDYYDYLTIHLESLSRQYKGAFDPTQPVRLFLIAPDFSQTIVNRCKWLNLPISLFTYTCLKMEGESDLVPVFTERQWSSRPQPVEITHMDDHLNYITDLDMRAKAQGLLDEIVGWKPENVTRDSIKYHISLKVNNRVFAYFSARRKHYIIATYDNDDEWKEFAVKNDDEATSVKTLVRASMERRLKE